ncbi:uracil phosphoribosyltransferase [Candidatus Dependentiae bacterium]|nr:uracil phosphoribosyltransferase [Candidatus Dependentiae bacterium]
MLKEVLITQLRNKETTIDQFRDIADKLSYLLVQQVDQYIKTKKIDVETPWEKTKGEEFIKQPKLIIILRSGFALLPAFLKFFNKADVGVVGLKRDEKTAQAHLYYLNLPKIEADDQVIILDPTIATGGSAVSSLEILKERGIKESQIIFASIICVQEGLDAIKQEFPNIKLIYLVKDEKLNAKKFIIPGFGDFGDRYFGTPVD